MRRRFTKNIKKINKLNGGNPDSSLERQYLITNKNINNRYHHKTIKPKYSTLQTLPEQMKIQNLIKPLNKQRHSLRKSHEVPSLNTYNESSFKNTSLLKQNFINNNNINKIINKKTRNDTMVENLSVIGNEIDNLKAEVDFNLPSRNTTEIIEKERALNKIYNYLQNHIQKLTTARAKLLYDKNNTNNKNTTLKDINKQSYYRLLLENNFITSIIKNIDDLDEKIKLFLDFFIFLEKTENNYTIEEFNTYTKKIGIRNKPKSIIKTLNKVNTVLNTSKDVNTIIINTKITNNKNQDTNIATNIGIIDNEIDNLNFKLQELEKNSNTNSYIITEEKTEIKYVIDFLKKHIKKLNDIRGEVIRLSKATTKTSFFNRFKKTKKNTEEQTTTKQTYYRLLLETNFIVKVSKQIKDQYKKFRKLYMFIRFLEKTKHKYTIEEFNKHTQLLSDYTKKETINNFNENFEKQKLKDPKFIKKQKQIIRNEIENTRIRTKLNDTLQQEKKMIELQLYSKIDDIIFLLKHNNIRELNFYKTLEYILNRNKNKNINIKLNKDILTRDILKSFFKSILDNNSLKKLNLDNILTRDNFDNDSFNFFETYLTFNTNLEELNISSCNMNPQYFSRIINAIISNSNLKLSTFIADNNKISFYNENNSVPLKPKIIASSLSYLLEKKNSLKVLSLSNCFINNEFLNEIMSKLSTNTILEEVNLSFNQISELQILKLVNILLKNKTSKMRINLCNNNPESNTIIKPVDNSECKIIKVNHITLLVNNSKTLIDNINLILNPKKTSKPVYQEGFIEQHLPLPSPQTIINTGNPYAIHLP